MGFSSISQSPEGPVAFSVPRPSTPSVPKQPHLSPPGISQLGPRACPRKDWGCSQRLGRSPAVGWGLELEGGASSPGWL